MRLQARFTAYLVLGRYIGPLRRVQRDFVCPSSRSLTIEGLDGRGGDSSNEKRDRAALRASAAICIDVHETGATRDASASRAK